MDWLETFDSWMDDSLDIWIGKSPEAIKERSEKQKEWYSKALAGISRSRKDEKKSHFQDDLLAKIIWIIIKDGKSDEIIKLLTQLSDAEFPSFITAGIISITSPEAVHCILQHYRLVSWFPVLSPRIVSIQFQQENLTQNEKLYINAWIELIFVLIKTSPSAVYLKRLKNNLQINETVLIEAISTWFTIFLSKLSITETKEIKIYSKFIVSEIQKSLPTIVFEDIDSGKLTHL